MRLTEAFNEAQLTDFMREAVILDSGFGRAQTRRALQLFILNGGKKKFNRSVREPKNGRTATPCIR